MKYYENFIELSDSHIIWRLSNPNIKPSDFEFIYKGLLDACIDEFEKIYGCEIYMLGRSGRHICVENTPKNRQSYYRMYATVKRLQNWLITEYNNYQE